ncbi:MAG: radical SAM protein [Candidatus Bathyarchaeota archaeon]|nr:MAG: radical SAM protein [Candidatus Bathyarchaeota archaeon]
MKFSFINPSPAPDTPDMVVTAWPPLGILYCAGVLMGEGIEVSILDQAVKVFSTRQTVNWVKKENPHILGFSVLNSSMEEAVKIARQAKMENPNLTIVFGNYHATFNAERILNKYPFVDMIVRGEGEYTCLELGKCLEKGGALRKVAGITFRKNGIVVSSPDRPLIKDVDSLPFPDRDLIDAQYSSTIYGVKVATKKFSTIVSSRGCPFRCTFCGCRKFAQGVWRPRSVENIMAELESLLSEGYEQFLFVDDNFTLNQKRVAEFCQKVKKEGIDIEWFCDSRVDNCRYDVFRQMVKVGCKILYFGMESANQRILNYYKKGITPNDSRSAVEKARKAGIDVIVGSFILGAPDETRREIQNTLKFAHELNIDVPQLNILGAFTGTDLWRDLVTKGFIDEDQLWETGAYVPRVSPQSVPFEEIRHMIYDYFRAFYLRPKLLLTEILRTMKSSYRFAGLINNAARLNRIINTVKQGVLLD